MGTALDMQENPAPLDQFEDLLTQQTGTSPTERTSVSRPRSVEKASRARPKAKAHIVADTDFADGANRGIEDLFALDDAAVVDATGTSAGGTTGMPTGQHTGQEQEGEPSSSSYAVPLGVAGLVGAAGLVTRNRHLAREAKELALRKAQDEIADKRYQRFMAEKMAFGPTPAMAAVMARNKAATAAKAAKEAAKKTPATPAATPTAAIEPASVRRQARAAATPATAAAAPAPAVTAPAAATPAAAKKKTVAKKTAPARAAAPAATAPVAAQAKVPAATKKFSTRQREQKATTAEKQLNRMIVGASVKVAPNGSYEIMYKGKRLGNQNWASIDDATKYIQSRIKAGKFVDTK